MGFEGPSVEKDAITLAMEGIPSAENPEEVIRIVEATGLVDFSSAKQGLDKMRILREFAFADGGKTPNMVETEAEKIKVTVRKKLESWGGRSGK